MSRLLTSLFGLSLSSLVCAAGFTVSSPDITNGGQLKSAQVFNGFGCEGGNIAPALSWSGEPAGTRSFAVTVYDPDAPTGSGWWHWQAVNLPATTHALPAGSGQKTGPALPAGAMQTRNDYGQAEFGGACPPKGDKPHRYIVTVWALKVDKLDLPADASAALVGYNLNANALDKAVMTAKYGR
ncbi:YbhB/YbcL family Raf kinase inhibitor-like protein [Chitinimonas sp.]|uniref:YbhB/YbcL family Raf kinase inhibitor-like protein n=1 Tax=Chitinimonas sp. TaxID=1934313 RepID=UPI0035AE69D2